MRSNPTTLSEHDPFDETGRNPLHALTYLEDRETEDLASLCCKRGASLEHNAQETEPTTLYLNRRPIEGSSLRWAAAKGMMCLFQDLLLLHEQNGIIIRDAVSIASHAAAFHHHIILGSLLEYQKTIPKLFLYEEILRPDRDWRAYLHLLLTSALTIMDILPLSRRLLHGISAPTARIATLELLLEEGVDPLNAPETTLPNGQRVSMGPSAVDLVLDIDDDQCFSVLALNIKSSYNEATILNAMSHSLQQCIAEDHLKCFKAVVKEFPQLINFVGELGTLTPLNMAARRPDPIYARILLEKGADVTVSNKDFSPLARAVVDGHLETADTIYEFCTDQQRQQTFGFNDVTGFTLMGRVMSVWGTRKKSQALVSAMHWIHGKGGAYPTINRKGDPIWSQILTRRPSSSAEYARLDDRMLETLFDMFPNKVNTPDSGGMFPIHWASVNGHRKAVELLLERQVDIDAETIGGERGLVPGGMTAFTMIATRIEEPPPADVERGGKVEIRRWRERAKDILQFLLSKGATVGQHPSRNDTFRSWKYLLHNTSYMTADGRDEDDEIEWKEDIWPQKLPKDDTSTKENQRNGGELIKPEAKRALQIILGGIMKREGEKLEIDEDDRENYKKYGQWLLQEVEFRREQFTKHGGLWDGCHSRELDPAWDKWHEPGARRRQDPTPMESSSGSS
jgi:ankyrin repeat protein